MKKKEYVDAINEIKADENLKQNVLNNVTKNKKNKKIYSILEASVIAFVMIISITVPIINDKNEVTPIEIVEQNNGLPTLGNFENLYNIMKDKESKYDAYYDTNGMLAITDAVSSTESSSKEESLEYSTTNIQVEGVDEADIVKTDGKYIYYISDSNVVIVGTDKNSSLKIASEISYKKEENFYPTELYISNNKLIIIGQKSNNNYNELLAVDTIYPVGDRTRTIAKVYDVQDKSNPKLAREIEIEGSY